MKIKFNVQYIFAAIWIVLIVLTIPSMDKGGKEAFLKSETPLLKDAARSEELQLKADLNSQISLALNMASSSLIIKYLSTPYDGELKDLALDEFESYRKSFLGKTVFWVSDEEMNFYSDGKNLYFVDTSNPDNYWYDMTVQATADYNFNINYNEALKMTNLWVNAKVMDDRGVPVGMVGTGIPLTNVIKSMYEGLDENYSMYLVNSSLEITGAEDESLITKKVHLNDYVKDLSNQEVRFSDEGYVIQTSAGLYYFAPLRDINWMAVIFSPYTQAQKNKSMMTNFLGFIITAIVLAMIQVLVVLVAPMFKMKKMRQAEKEAGVAIRAETQSLSVSAKENAAISQDQNAAVKEIVATMEDNNALAGNISEKIKNVSGLADRTTGEVKEGVAALEVCVRQLNDISQANNNTIEGIKDLGKKIEDIWNIVTIINNVADQAKIIAFNAELEASAAGPAGKNFHIVSTEIRRLADSIIGSTKEIKDSISKIQKSSDTLILSAEDGTAKIKEGCESTAELQKKFEAIKEASEGTSGSAGDITQIIQQQATATEQVLITLKQIASGIENFSQSTANISASVENLKKTFGLFGDKK